MPAEAEAYFNRGNTYLATGQYDQAIADYTKALELNPQDALAYNNRGLAYFYLKGEYDKAWEDVSKAQELGFQINPKFLEDLRKASGRQRYTIFILNDAINNFYRGATPICKGV